MTDSERTEGQTDRPEPAAPGRAIADRTRLYRSEENRILGGVAAGVAHHFDADPVIVRLIWVLSALLGGVGALAYLVLWIVLPPYSRVYGETGSAQRGADASTDVTVPPTGKLRSPIRSDLVIGGILIVLGALLLIGNLDIGPGWNIFGRLWPLLLIVPAAAIVTPRRGRWAPTGVLLFGGVILTVGAISLIGSLDVWLGYGAWSRLWPLILISIGAAFLLPRLEQNG